jgi:hypothetical protein
MYLYLSVCLSIYLSVCLPACLPTHPPTYLPTYPSIRLSIHPSILISIYLSMYLSIYMSVCLLSVRPFVCLSVCLSIHRTARASQPFRHCLMLLYQQLDVSWGMTKGTYRTNRFMASPRGTPCYIPLSGAEQVCGAHFRRKRKTNVQGHLYRRRNGILDIHAFVSESLQTSLATRESEEACALSMT